MENKQFPLEGDFLPEDEVPNLAAPAAEDVSSGQQEHELLTAPEYAEEILPDENAMAWHGMTHPTEPEAPFDMGILNDPEFDEPSAQTLSEQPPEELYTPEEASVSSLPDVGDILPEESDSEDYVSSVAPPEEYMLTGETSKESFLQSDLLSEELTEAPVAEVPVPVSTQELFRDEAFHDAFGDGEEFDRMFHAPEPEIPAPSRTHIPRKGRPKRRKGEVLFGLPHFMVTLVWLAVILITGVTLGRMLWVCAADVLAFGREDRAVTVTIYEADTIDDIADKLYKAELIRYPGLFKLYAAFAVDDGEIDPGIWDLNTRYDYHALVNMMSASSSRRVVEDLLIPEGYTCRQIFQLMEEKKICTAVDIAAYAASGELKDYWFLENVARDGAYCLEGYLFPDTYDFYENSSPREVLEKMLDNFDYRFTEEMKAQLNTLNGNVTNNTFTVRQVVIVASMIEKETANNDESPKIASVIYNRLFNWGSTPAYLNIDASIVYALDGKTDLTTEDLKVDSPYNTYTNVGLTPGPIANPGLASIRAALNPAATNYYYYVLNPSTGTHQFSTTLEEHEAYVEQFRGE